MEQIQTTFPVFESNQVLTNGHLNDIFNYLDEQERLTRANLIGIGIVCGLEIKLDIGTNTIHLSRGCGITSEGYLILEPENIDLIAYREYDLPKDIAYPTFINPDTTPEVSYPLWELFPSDSPNGTPLTTEFLNGKVVVLFLELDKEALRNCSPNNCDDRGSEVTATVRRLLIEEANLTRIIVAANDLEATTTKADLEARLLARLNLPDLRVRRYDVPNSNPVTSHDVLVAFHTAIQRDGLASALVNALNAAYDVFAPLLEDVVSSNHPFEHFMDRFGFLDTLPTTTTQVRFLQYYYDFFNDLLNAYDDFRWKGAELLCACCPNESLFPRHLMLGSLSSESIIYRNTFLTSSAVSGCEEQEKELKLLFRRLVEMYNSFTDDPPLPAQEGDTQIRITPSRLAGVPLSEKAIPYYYVQTGISPLFTLWNGEKTRRNRANQNLSYRSYEYSPTPPGFVTDALSYDLEPYNFLRIEGHLGKNYQAVLSTLLSLRDVYRLPIEIVALRTGAFDESIQIDLTKEQARFEDLESLYDAFREDLLRNLAEGVRYLYGISMNTDDPPGGTPQLPLLKKYAPEFKYETGSVGAWYEKYLTQLQAKTYIDIDQNNINPVAVLIAYCVLFAGTSAPAPEFYAHIVSIYYLSKLSEIVPDSLAQLQFADFTNKYQDLIALTRYLRSDQMRTVPDQLSAFVPKEELIDYFDQVLFNCRLDAIKAIVEEYARRIRDIKQKQFLSYFLSNHPGIQHKAGVPLGGTFIIVYHDEPEPTVDTAVADAAPERVKSVPFAKVIPGKAELVSGAIKRLRNKKELLRNPDIQMLIGELTGQIPRPDFIEGVDDTEEIFAEAISELEDGTTIADFFLPYLCVTEGATVQFVLPKAPPTFSVQVGCSNADNIAEVTLTPAGGRQPFSVKVDDQNYQPLTGTLLLSAGTRHITIKGAEGTESATQEIEIPGVITLGEPAYECVEGDNQYTVEFDIAGGTPPYTADRGTVDNDNKRYISGVLPGNTDSLITITDNKECQVTVTVNHSCLPPLTFTANVGCTNQDNFAEIGISPTGGQTPYKMKVGAGPVTDFTSPLSLSVGVYNIVLTDANGATSSQTISVVPALTLSEAGFECLDNGTYRSTIIIQGGTPPYTLNDVEISNPSGTFPLTFNTEPISSGTASDITIKDSNNCSASIQVQHTCEPPCDFPCDGASTRCSYRLWLQPPVEGVSYTNYSSYRNSSIICRYNGNEFKLPFNENLLITTDELNQNFDGAFGAAIKKLNEAIKNKIGAGRIELSFNPDEDQGTFRSLHIEHFDCESFSIAFSFMFNYKSEQGGSNNERDARIIASYTNEPLNDDVLFDRFVSSLAKDTIPAFNCFRRNQCEDTDFKPICKTGKPEIKISQKDVGRGQFVLEGESPDEIISWIWEIPSISPVLYFLGKESTITGNIENNTPPLPVRLTTITREGCFNSIIESISNLTIKV